MRLSNAENRGIIHLITDYFLVTPDSLIDPDAEIEYAYVGKHTDDYSLLPLSEQERAILSMFRDLPVKGQMKIVQQIMNVYDEEKRK